MNRTPIILIISLSFISTNLIADRGYKEEYKSTPPLWGNVVNSMSPRDVVQKVENSYQVNPPDPNDLSSLVKVNDFLWHGKKFNINFIFYNCKLQRVILSESEKKRSFKDAISSIQPIAETFNEKYNLKFKKSEILLEGNIKDYQMMWEGDNDKQIGLTILSVYEPTASINISFGKTGSDLTRYSNYGNEACLPTQTITKTVNEYNRSQRSINNDDGYRGKDPNIISNVKDPGPPVMKLLPPPPPPKLKD